MKIKVEMNTTENSRVYNKLRKMLLERTGKIHCARCPYHKYENWDRDTFNNNNWKNFRKKQFKEKRNED